MSAQNSLGTADHSRPPRVVPLYVKYLLGCSQDASREEVTNAWTSQVIPLTNRGPIAVFDREALQLMAAGVSGADARRLYKKTARGQQLWDAADREGKIRARAAAGTPAFLSSGN